MFGKKNPGGISKEDAAMEELFASRVTEDAFRAMCPERVEGMTIVTIGKFLPGSILRAKLFRAEVVTRDNNGVWATHTLSFDPDFRTWKVRGGRFGFENQEAAEADMHEREAAAD